MLCIGLVNKVIEDDQETAISTFDVFDTASLEQSTTKMVNDIAMLRKFCEDQIVQQAMEKKKKQERRATKKARDRRSTRQSRAKATQMNVVVTPKKTDIPGDVLEGKSGKLSSILTYTPVQFTNQFTNQ